MRPKRRGIDMDNGYLVGVGAVVFVLAVFAGGYSLSRFAGKVDEAAAERHLACTAEEMPRAFVLHGSKAVRAPERDRTCRTGLAYVWRDDDGRVRWFSGDPDPRGPVWYADDAENDGPPPRWAEWGAQ